MEEIMPHLIKVQNEEELAALGYEKSKDGIYILSEPEAPWLQGGES
jgi:hypothetical protein